MTDMIVDFNKKHYDLMPSFDVVIIDEAQDLSWLQWKMVERVVRNAKRVYVAGVSLGRSKARIPNEYGRHTNNIK
jgi:superfamily I DNA and RNA helicase